MQRGGIAQAAEVDPSALERQVGVCRASVIKLPLIKAHTDLRCPMAGEGQELPLEERHAQSRIGNIFWRASSTTFARNPARQNHFPAHASFMRANRCQITNIRRI